MISFNRHDPALFVRKRHGVGWTLNLGNPVAWIIVVATVVLVVVVKRRGRLPRH